MRCAIRLLSADEIFGEQDDQVAIHGHLHTFAEQPPAAACAPTVGDISASSVQPLDRAASVGSPERALRLAALRRCQRDQVKTGLFPQNPPKLIGRAFLDPIGHLHSVR